MASNQKQILEKGFFDINISVQEWIVSYRGKKKPFNIKPALI